MGFRPSLTECNVHGFAPGLGKLAWNISKIATMTARTESFYCALSYQLETGGYKPLTSPTQWKLAYGYDVRQEIPLLLA